MQCSILYALPAKLAISQMTTRGWAEGPSGNPLRARLVEFNAIEGGQNPFRTAGGTCGLQRGRPLDLAKTAPYTLGSSVASTFAM